MRTAMFRSRSWRFLVGLLGVALAGVFIQPAQAARSGRRTSLSRLLRAQVSIGVREVGRARKTKNAGVAAALAPEVSKVSEGRAALRPPRRYVVPTIPWQSPTQPW